VVTATKRRDNHCACLAHLESNKQKLENLLVTIAALESIAIIREMTQFRHHTLGQFVTIVTQGKYQNQEVKNVKNVFQACTILKQAKRYAKIAVQDNIEVRMMGYIVNRAQLGKLQKQEVRNVNLAKLAVIAIKSVTNVHCAKKVNIVKVKYRS
jgi:hypothetical protein